ncbi:MAG TPA: glycosyltransferase family 4 protein [Blastocatellia bacterium]|nr:glycosyltransferase family 4 protein [Blastocatellia bacterium]
MKVLLFANTDWYLYNFRLSLAEALRSKGAEVVLVSPDGKYRDRFEQAGFRWIDIPLVRRSLNPLAEFVTVFRLVRLYRRERPTIVHHFTIKCVIYGSIAARFANVKAVINALTGLGHVFTDNGAQARLLRVLIQTIGKPFLRSTQVIFQNPEDQLGFEGCGLVEENASHLIRGSGVNVDRFKPCATRSSSDKKYVLLASRLLWAKGVAEYVEAAHLIRQQMPEAVFLIAGETDPGNPGSVPQAVIDRWIDVGDVEFLGHCDDMQALIDKADLVALPTYYGEGVPRILVEAAASGKPLVATDMPGCREIVEPKLNGILIPARDSRALANVIKEILTDDECRERMGRHSRQLACEQFSDMQVINATLQVYRRALPVDSPTLLSPGAPAKGSEAYSG